MMDQDEVKYHLEKLQLEKRISMLTDAIERRMNEDEEVEKDPYLCLAIAERDVARADLEMALSTIVDLGERWTIELNQRKKYEKQAISEKAMRVAAEERWSRHMHQCSHAETEPNG